jgi:TolB protein
VTSSVLAVTSVSPVNGQAAGTGTRLYKSGDQVYPAAWSRAGQLLVTVVTGGVPTIRLLTSAGQPVRDVSGPVANSWASDFDPTGREILVESYVRGVSDLYRVVLETGETTRVTSTPWNEWHPSWSPDGHWLVLDSDSSETPRLTLVELASGRTAPLTRSARAEQGAKWSPGGRRLAFHRHTGAGGDADYDVVVIDRETRREIPITTDRADSSSPSWSPDGARLAFSSNREGRYDIYVACADGSSIVRLTDGGADKKYPVWAPDGRRIVYQMHGDGIWIVDTRNVPDCRSANR